MSQATEWRQTRETYVFTLRIVKNHKKKVRTVIESVETVVPRKTTTPYGRGVRSETVSRGGRGH